MFYIFLVSSAAVSPRKECYLLRLNVHPSERVFAFQCKHKVQAMN